MEAMKPGRSVLAYRLQIVHRNDRIAADQRAMTADELGRFLPAQKIKQLFLVKSADQ
jgi:hypothetical protein